MKRVLVVLAEGFEEIEAVTPVDYLRRAGVEVVVAGLHSLETRGARGITVKADLFLSDFHGSFDCLLLPGGGTGTNNLAASREVVDLVKRSYRDGKIIAAICAAPAIVLGKTAGVLKGKRFTCYPGLETEVPDGIYCADRVVVDGNLVTSRSAGTASDFALRLIAMLVSEEQARITSAQVLPPDKL